MKRPVFIICAALGFINAAAQDLHTEITVDRTVLPVLHDASRPKGLTPEIVAPEVKVRHLNSAEYTQTSELSPDLGVLPAAAWADSIEPAGYRGYGIVGYLPLYNLAIDAGYRVIDRRDLNMGVWAQFNGFSYNGDLPYYKDALLANNVLTLGGNGSWKVDRVSTLSAAGKVSFESVRHPFHYLSPEVEYLRSYRQGAKDGKAELCWASRAGNVVYDIKGALSYFSLDLRMPNYIRRAKGGLKQAVGTLSFNLGYADDQSSVPWVGIDGDLSVMRSTNLPVDVSWWQTAYRTLDLGQGHFRPYLRFDNDQLQGLVGFNLSASRKYGGKVHIAPEFEITWRPLKFLSLYADVTGTEYINYMDRIFDANPYVQPYFAYGRTNMPLIAEGGVNVGPYRGVAFGVKGGYAVANDFLVPQISLSREGLLESGYIAADVKSWYIGATAGYAYDKLFAVDGGIYLGGSDSKGTSWYQWADGARLVADFNVRVTPIDALDIRASYNLRTDRKALSRIFPYNQASGMPSVGEPNLGNVNNVNIGANYRFNEWLTGFLQLDNLLNKRYNLISAMPAQGLNGLLGVSVLF